MSEIQDEAYTEACEEIDRLKSELAFQTGMAAQADVACIRLKALCARAARALEGQPLSLDEKQLAKELREAAK